MWLIIYDLSYHGRNSFTSMVILTYVFKKIISMLVYTHTYDLSYDFLFFYCESLREQNGFGWWGCSCSSNYCFMLWNGKKKTRKWRKEWVKHWLQRRERESHGIYLHLLRVYRKSGTRDPIMYFKHYTIKSSFYWTVQQDGVGLLHGLYENLHCACANNIMYFKLYTITFYLCLTIFYTATLQELLLCKKEVWYLVMWLT